MVLVTYLHVAGCSGAMKRWMVENFQKLSRILLAVGRLFNSLHHQKLLMQIPIFRMNNFSHQYFMVQIPCTS